MSLVFLLASLSLQPNPSSILTVCEVLRDLSSYQRKAIVVVGRWSATEEGRWLSEDGCAMPIKTKTFTWPNDLSLEWDPHSGLDLKTSGFNQAQFERALEKLRRTTKLKSGQRWAVIYGQIETRKLRITQAKNEEVVPHGFGHLDGSPAKLSYGRKSVQFLPSPDAPKDTSSYWIPHR